MIKEKRARFDWVMIGCYLALVIFGWMNIYSSSVDEIGFVFSSDSKYVMHILWILTSFTLASIILFVIQARAYSSISWPLYVLVVILLIAVAFIGVEVNGSKSWFALGPFRMQPAEFSKIATSLALASVMGKYDFKFSDRKCRLMVFSLIAIPMLAILAEKETGSILVYLGFLVVFYLEGMSPWLLIIGILSIVFFILTLLVSPAVALLVLISLVAVLWAFYSRKFFVSIVVGALIVASLSFLPKLMELEPMHFMQVLSYHQWIAVLTGVPALFFAIHYFASRQVDKRNLLLGYLLGVILIFSVQFIFDNVLQDHQRGRIEVLLGMKEDPMGVGYNVHQSLIAIGSGGFTGKGFLGGTQTRFDFVPEQSTDFIFCTIGEEWGFLGSLFVLGIYLALILRILNSASKQSDSFYRVYGYCVAMCLFMHVLINICMTIGLMPVIGIPLPMLSYGGSSLWAFTILIFIYIRFDYEGRS